jgi:MFS family permease
MTTTNLSSNAPSGLTTFLIIWAGQLVSIVGSGLTGFALGVYVYQETGSVTQLGLVLLANTLPSLILAPIAGVLVDRWDRRLVMILSDTGAGLATLGIFLLLLSGNLQIWHIYLAGALSSIFGIFQQPAFMASTTLLVPKQHYGRAAGLTQLGHAVGQILSPALAGFLILTIEIQGVILIDFITYLIAVTSLIVIRIPKPPAKTSPQTEESSILQDAIYGLSYIRARSGLLGMLLLFAFVNLTLGLYSALYTPLILSFSTADVLGTILSVSGVGMLIGSLVMSVWGGSKKKIHGLLGSIFLAGIALSFSGVRTNPWIIGVSSFFFLFFVPIANSSSQAIWQVKVAADVQGRVFATRRMLASIASPLAYILAGPLADGVFEPLLGQGGALARSIGKVIGVGPGRGIGLMFILIGILISLSTVVGYFYPRLRNVETELPDIELEESEPEQNQIVPVEEKE